MRTLRLTVILVCLAAALNLASAQSVLDVAKLAKKKGGEKSSGGIVVKLPPYFGPKKRLAVEDCDVKVTPTDIGGGDSGSIPPPTDFGQGLTEMLITALVNTNRFLVIERTDQGLANMQKEQNLQGVNADSKPAANNMMGAQVLVQGTVTEFSYSKSDQGGTGNLLHGLGLSSAKTRATVTIDVKLYDASTGEVYDSKKADGHADSSATNFSLDREDFKFNNSQFQNSPLGKATRQAIEKAVLFIAQSMEKKVWEARVATVVDEGNGPRLYLNAGSKAGLKVGDELEVFADGFDVTDPDTGKVISHTKGKKIGLCRIESVEDEISIAKPIEGDGFAAKDTVRFPEKQDKTGS